MTASPYDDAGRPAPTDIRYRRADRTLEIVFADGRAATFSAEFLRVMSPSAEVQGHAPEQRVVVPGKRAVAIAEIEPVGAYAVRLVFDDGHGSGLYSWDWFYRRLFDREALWRRYEQELAALGKGRD